MKTTGFENLPFLNRKYRPSVEVKDGVLNGHAFNLFRFFFSKARHLGLYKSTYNVVDQWRNVKKALEKKSV